MNGYPLDTVQGAIGAVCRKAIIGCGDALQIGQSPADNVISAHVICKIVGTIAGISDSDGPAPMDDDRLLVRAAVETPATIDAVQLYVVIRQVVECLFEAA